METYKALSREEIEGLTRVEVEGLLWPATKRRAGHKYYPNYVRLEEPPALYTDLELKLLLRLTQWVNGQKAAMWMHRELQAFDSGCNFISVVKQADVSPTLPWRGSKANWRRGENRTTLAELLGVFYMENLKPGMWVCTLGLVPHEVQEGEGHSSHIRVRTFQGETFNWEVFSLVAPTQGELEELIEAFKREREAQGRPYVVPAPYEGERKVVEWYPPTY